MTNYGLRQTDFCSAIPLLRVNLSVPQHSQPDVEDHLFKRGAFQESMYAVSDKNIVSAVKHWLDTTVVGLNLCPFARAPLARDAVRFAVTRADTMEALLHELVAELQRLEHDTEVETTLLIHPELLGDFDDYNQFLTLSENLLQALGYEGTFQIASFHPDYQFAGTTKDDAENYSNRSPYPLLHLLREDALEKAIASHPAPEQIPERNIEFLTQLGRAKLEQMLLGCKEHNEE